MISRKDSKGSGKGIFRTSSITFSPLPTTSLIRRFWRSGKPW